MKNHFLNFVDFAKRRNLLIKNNTPFQLFLSLGLSIFKLAVHKNRTQNQEKLQDERKLLFDQYNALSKQLSEHFIDMDFGDIIDARDIYPHCGSDVRNSDSKITTNNVSTYVQDLNDFNRDDDDDDDYNNENKEVCDIGKCNNEKM